MYAEFATKVYQVISSVPKWAFLVASGAIGSFIIQLMHGKGSSATSTTTKSKDKAASNGEITQDEKAPTTASGKPKRYVVKPAKEVHPELDMTSSIASVASTTSTASKPSMATRSSSKRKTKK
jgi:NADPH:quinone reductase-like Zn-dependent oxidoreductase